jgi:hypothetical protein
MVKVREWSLEVFHRARKARYAQEAIKVAQVGCGAPMSKSQQRAKCVMWEDDFSERDGDRARKILENSQ